jgi:hypothetical protein
MNAEVLDEIVHFTQSNPNFPRFLNRDLRPVLQHVCVSSPNGAASNLFISGIPYAVDTCQQFCRPVYTVFSRTDQALARPSDEIQQIIARILPHNETLHGCVRQGLDCARQIVTVLMAEPDEGGNLAIFNAEGLLLREHEMEVLRVSSEPQKPSQFHTPYSQLVCPLIFWNGSG